MGGSDPPTASAPPLDNPPPPYPQNQNPYENQYENQYKPVQNQIHPSHSQPPPPYDQHKQAGEGTRLMVIPKSRNSIDLFDCFGDCGTCVLSLFCPCIVFGQIAHRSDPRDDECLCCLLYAGLYFISAIPVFCLHAYIREKTYTRLNIYDYNNPCGDGFCPSFICAAFCWSCALTQTWRVLQQPRAPHNHA